MDRQAAYEGTDDMTRKPRYEADLAKQLRLLFALTAVMEHKFHPTRKWRFDLAFPDQKVGIEIEGGLWANGRHNRGAGYIADMEKYREAVKLGWRVLRYPPQMVKDWTAAEEIATLVLGREVRIG
jgi:very-short-patch-repair endonuclease